MLGNYYGHGKWRFDGKAHPILWRLWDPVVDCHNAGWPWRLKAIIAIAATLPAIFLVSYILWKLQ